MELKSVNREKEVDGRSKSQDQEGSVYHWAKGSNILVCVSLRYMWGNSKFLGSRWRV